MSGDTLRSLLGALADGPLAEAVAGRAKIFEMTAACERAHLMPSDPGGLGLAERAGLACRVARLNAETALAEHYGALGAASPDPDRAARIADPAWAGEDARMTALLRHADLVTARPRDATPEDIAALRDAGFEEADIVRLSGLLSFLAYQVRLLAGLRLVGAAS